jgi:hypothetical protein
MIYDINPLQITLLENERTGPAISLPGTPGEV